MDFEIYESIEGRKRRFVVSESLEMFSKSNMVDYACKYFHVAGNHVVLNTSFLLPGVYLLTYLDAENRKITKKIVKQ